MSDPDPLPKKGDAIRVWDIDRERWIEARVERVYLLGKWRMEYRLVNGQGGDMPVDWYRDKWGWMWSDADYVDWDAAMKRNG